jgi:hypothetical protein
VNLLLKTSEKEVVRELYKGNDDTGCEPVSTTAKHSMFRRPLHTVALFGIVVISQISQVG